MNKLTIRLPKMVIDPHCHARDLKQSRKTTVFQTLLEAHNSLISISVMMPNTDPAMINEEICAAYSDIIFEAQNKLGLPEQYGWFGLTDDSLAEFEKALQLDWIVGGKVYPLGKNGKAVTTGAIGVANDETLLEAMRLARESDKTTAYHCDDPDIIAREGHTINAEATYVKKILRLAEEVPGARIIICHVSCVESALLILDAQKRGMDVALELGPHYLWFDADGTHWKPGLDSVFYKCFNHFRSRRHRLFLTSLLTRKDAFVIIGSDNAPHTPEEKLVRKLGGLPTNQHLVPVICTLAKEIGLSDERIGELLSWNASRFLNIPAPHELVEYELEERIDNLTYNNGKIVNPWNGSKLLFPIRMEER